MLEAGWVDMYDVKIRDKANKFLPLQQKDIVRQLYNTLKHKPIYCYSRTEITSADCLGKA